jgi:hypothetical protein
MNDRFLDYVFALVMVDMETLPPFPRILDYKIKKESGKYAKSARIDMSYLKYKLPHSR